MKKHLMFCFIFFLSGSNKAEEIYPKIVPIHKRVAITSDKTAFEFYLSSKEREKAYEFVCRDGEYYDEEYFGNFSGFYQCKLFEILKNGHLGTDVLGPDGNWRSSVTRARFDMSSIIGGCKNHQEYGHERTFLTQGMKVNINIHDLKPTDGMEKIFENYSFILDVDIINHPSVQSEFSGYEKEECTAEYEGVDKNGNFTDKVKIIKHKE